MRESGPRLGGPPCLTGSCRCWCRWPPPSPARCWWAPSCSPSARAAGAARACCCSPTGWRRCPTWLDAAVAAQNERLGRALADSADRTQDSARRIHERLAVIDAARANIEALGGQVTNLASILGNKQARGAFGEVQLARHAGR
ncbi:hypothetical protein [Dankookia sp. P2]|uniref:hypothetical protein n=1 Tax=Dankookia sp. P2 TaxID=3423955 RepID=UPI003D6791D2